MEVHINSTVTVNCVEPEDSVEFGGYSGVTVDGGGKLIINNGDLDLISMTSAYYSTIENVSVCLFCEGIIHEIYAMMNLTFKNCPMIVIEMSNMGGDTEDATTINVGGELIVSDSNIKISLVTNDTDTNYLIRTVDGITMSEPPTGFNIIFSDGDTDYSEWNDDIVMIYSESKESTMNVVVIPEDNTSSINMYDVSLYATAAVAVVLVLVGSIYAGKH